jgi:hypothetical protein
MEVDPWPCITTLIIQLVRVPNYLTMKRERGRERLYATELYLFLRERIHSPLDLSMMGSTFVLLI